MACTPNPFDYLWKVIPRIFYKFNKKEWRKLKERREISYFLEAKREMSYFSTEKKLFHLNHIKEKNVL